MTSPYSNIHDAPVPTNAFNLIPNMITFWLQASIFNALIVVGLFLLFVYVAYIWLTHR